MNFDGTRFATGAILNDGNGFESGHVRIYELGATGWAQVGSDIDGEAARDWSGHSVSISSDGNRVAIGANLNDGNGPKSGHTRVYEFDGSAWTKLNSLDQQNLSLNNDNGDPTNSHNSSVSHENDGYHTTKE